MLPGLLLYLLLLLLALRYHEKLHAVVSTHLLYVGSNCCKAQGLDESVEGRLNLNKKKYIYIYIYSEILSRWNVGPIYIYISPSRW